MVTIKNIMYRGFIAEGDSYCFANLFSGIRGLDISSCSTDTVVLGLSVQLADLGVLRDESFREWRQSLKESETLIKEPVSKLCDNHTSISQKGHL